MPIYSYRCEDCQHTQDILRKISDPPLVACPSCGAAAFRKQVTAAGFQLKGSGWYVTDFRNPQAGKDTAKATSGKEGEAAPGTAAGADKPAPPTAPGAKEKSAPAATVGATPASSGKGASSPPGTNSAASATASN